MDIIFQKKKNGLEIYLLVLEIPSKQTFLPLFLNTLFQVRKLLYDVAQYCKKNWLISHTQTHKSMFGGSNLNVVDIVGYFLFLTTVILPAPVIKCTGKFHLELLASLVVCVVGTTEITMKGDALQGCTTNIVNKLSRPANNSCHPHILTLFFKKNLQTTAFLFNLSRNNAFI